jgi:hypothetical protein
LSPEKKLADGALLKIEQSNIQSTELNELMNNRIWGFLLDSLKDHLEGHNR